jgi:protoporphyrinogen oxidase
LLSRGEGTDAASRHFLYPRRGIGELATAIEHRLAGRCLIGCGARSFRFERKGRRLTSLTYTGDGQPRRVLFKKVLSTIPLQELFSCLPGDVVLPAVDARTIGYRSLIVAALVVDKPRVSAWHWCYFPQKDILFSRLHEPKAWSQDMVSQKGKTLLCAEIFCDHNDFTWHRDDGQIAFHVKEGLLKSGLLQATDVVSDFRVERVAYAYPLHLCGAEGALASLRDFFNFFDNLRLAGRSGTHSYFNMEVCLDNVRESLGAW